MKNISSGSVITLSKQIDYVENNIARKSLVQSDVLNMNIFAIDKDKEISTHTSSGDALLMALEGQARITIDDEIYNIKQGESIVMPANHPHAVFATERFKMLLIVEFS